MARISSAASLLLAALLLLGSCQREKIELYYTGRATVRVNIDWDTHFGGKPTGMTIMLAKNGSDDIIFSDVTNTVEGYDLELEPGTYRMLIFSLSTGEYGSMRFYQMNNFTEAYAYANKLQRTTDYWDVNISYMREPEHIGCAVDTFTVLPEMIDGDFQFVDWREKITDYQASLVLNETVAPMTTELFIRVKVLGFKYMTGVIGNLSGLADGFLLSQAWRRPQTGYILLDNWTATPAPEESDSVTSVGYITTHVSTFGLPRGRELIIDRDSLSNLLSLCFTLIDDTQHLFRYPVGKEIKYREAELTGVFSKVDVTLDMELLVETPFYEKHDPIILPYAQPTGTGAFDAEVAPWGDEETIEVPF